MKHLAPACFRAFACAGSSCPDSCCRAGWEIVPDEETLALYQTLPGETGEQIRAGIVPGEEPLLKQDQSRVCVLLDPDGLCCVQKHFGHEALCRVCREYPRFHREFGGLTEHGVSLSCPTAYALAVAAPPAWEEWEDEAPPVPNDLDPKAYLRLRKGRALALDLLAREDLPLWQRVALVRRLAAALQGAPERIVHHDYAIRMRRWITVGGGAKPPKGMACAFEHSSPARSAGPHWGPGAERACDAPQVRFGTLARAVEGAGPYSIDAALARRFLALEILSPAWKDALERFAAMAEAGALPEDASALFETRTAGCRPYRAGTLRTAGCRPYRRITTRTAGCRPYKQKTTRTAECRPYMAETASEEYARWLWHELYKYWMDALDDGNLLGRVDRSLDMLRLGIAMDRAFPEEGPVLRRISREIEHCEENLAALLPPSP